MSRYRGPRFKKIRRLGTLPGLTSKKPTVGSEINNISRGLTNPTEVMDETIAS